MHYFTLIILLFPLLSRCLPCRFHGNTTSEVYSYEARPLGLLASNSINRNSFYSGSSSAPINVQANSATATPTKIRASASARFQITSGSLSMGAKLSLTSSTLQRTDTSPSSLRVNLSSSASSTGTVCASSTRSLSTVSMSTPKAGLNNSELKPDLSSYTLSQLIPWSNAATLDNFTNAPMLKVEIDGHVYSEGVVMDTGSTGLTVPATDLQDWDPKGLEPGWKFLSSSKLLYNGYWVNKNITFMDNETPMMTTNTPILAVVNITTCWGHTNNDGPNCNNVSHIDTSPSSAYLGVGFGREQDGMTQCTPDKNPLLHPTTFHGVEVGPNFRPGYIVSSEGVTIGLTTNDTAGFLFSSLEMQAGSEAPYDWAETSMCVSVGSAPCENGQLLVDTGINNMYLSSAYPWTTGDLTIKFPNNRTAAIAEYSFADGRREVLLAPSTVVETVVSNRTYVNTGRYFLKGYDIAFDAAGGYFGMRRVAQNGALS